LVLYIEPIPNSPYLRAIQHRVYYPGKSILVHPAEGAAENRVSIQSLLPSCGKLLLPPQRRKRFLNYHQHSHHPSSNQLALGIGVVLSGVAGVFCSIMIYQDTRRTFWGATMTSLKFIGTTLLLGPATILCNMLVQAKLTPGLVSQAPVHQMANLLSEFILLVATGKLLWELSVYRHLHDSGWTTMKRTALLMSGPLKFQAVARFVCGTIGGIVLPLLGLLGLVNVGTALGTLVFLLSGELLERYLFFTAVIPPKMPGGIAS
jgi:formate dehydrogenase iron-sulfur subunit